MTIKEAALTLVKQGINPIPFVSVPDPKKPSGYSKKPMISEWVKYQTQRMTESEVDKYFTDETEMIGIVTGNISGLSIVDVDDRTGNTFGYTSKLKVSTMNGGTHLYFKYQHGLKNKVKKNGLDIDIRSDGGLVVIPPSPGYRWNPEFNLKHLSDLITRLDDFPKDLMTIEEPVSFDFGSLIGTSEGSRDDQMLRASMSAASNVVWKNSPYEFELSRLIALNKTFTPPLSEMVVVKKLETGIKKAQLDKEIKTKRRSVRTYADMVNGRLDDRAMEKLAPSTGMLKLDQIIKGFVPKHFYTMTGDTNVGKTTLALNFAYNLSKQGKKVMYYALEPENTTVDYLASIRLRKPYSALSESDIQWDCPNIDFAVKDDGIDTIDQLIAKIHDSDRYDLIIIDHVGYFVNGETGNFVQEQSNMIKKLVQEAKRKKCAILGIAHLKKPAKGNNKVSDVDIAGSNAFRTDSTEVLVATRNKNENGEWSNNGVLMVTKTKSSSKGGGAVPIYFHEGGGLIQDHQIKIEEEDELTQIFS